MPMVVAWSWPGGGLVMAATSLTVGSGCTLETGALRLEVAGALFGERDRRRVVSDNCSGRWTAPGWVPFTVGSSWVGTPSMWTFYVPLRPLSVVATGGTRV